MSVVNGSAIATKTRKDGTVLVVLTKNGLRRRLTALYGEGPARRIVNSIKVQRSSLSRRSAAPGA